jgi:hypothetical protein
MDCLSRFLLSIRSFVLSNLNFGILLLNAFHLRSVFLGKREKKDDKRNNGERGRRGKGARKEKERVDRCGQVGEQSSQPPPL